MAWPPQLVQDKPSSASLIAGITLSLILAAASAVMFPRASSALVLGFFQLSTVAVAQTVDVDWYAPKKTEVNNLTQVLNGEGVYGFIYDTSETPDELYGTYNWCNMPHVRAKEYVKAKDGFELQYVELVRLITA